MREIKFRAWDKQTKKMWMSKCYLLIDIVDGRPFNTVEDMYMPRNRYALMQYTGLKDKNGKEVYDGDIVKEGGRLSKVRFSKSYARFELETPTGRAGFYGFYGEVVGNIYEDTVKDEKPEDQRQPGKS